MLLPTFSSLPLHKFYEGGKGGVRVRQHLNHKKKAFKQTAYI